jgi:hypothetical protein
VRDPSELDGAFAATGRDGLDGFTVIEDVKLISSFRKIVEVAIQLGLPSIGFVDYADSGGFFGYGADFLELYRRVARFVTGSSTAQSRRTVRSSGPRNSSSSST